MDVFVLGAGFSRAISRHMPVMSGLVAEGFNRRKWPGGGYPADHRAAFGRDLELWLTFLAADHARPSPAENARNRADFIDASTRLTTILLEAQNTALAGALPRWLPPLVAAWHARQSTVVTFNHDTLVEKAFTELNPGDIGRGHTPLYPVPPTNIQLRLAGIFGGSRPATFALLKLHGSLNWCFSGAASYFGESIYDLGVIPGWHGGETAASYTEAAPDKQPLIVPPTLAKSTYFENETPRPTWRLAPQALTRAE